MSTRIAINEDNMRKYTTFFKDLYSHTHTTQHKPVDIASLVNKHGVARSVIPAAIDLRFIEKKGDRRNTKYRWIGVYPEPIETRKILVQAMERLKKPAVRTTPIIKDNITFKLIPNEDITEDDKPFFSLKDDNAMDIVKKLRGEGYTQEQIGKRAGVHGSAVSKFLTRAAKKQETKPTAPFVKDTTDRKKEFMTPQPIVEKEEPTMIESVIDDAYLNIDQVVDLTGISKSTIYKLTSAREIPHYKKAKHLFFNKEEVMAWWTDNKIETVEIEKKPEVKVEVESVVEEKVEKKYREKKVKLLWGLYSYIEQVEV